MYSLTSFLTVYYYTFKSSISVGHAYASADAFRIAKSLDPVSRRALAPETIWDFWNRK